MFIPAEGQVKKATDRAVLFQFKHTKTEHWIPRSCIEDGMDIQPYDEEISIAEWFIEKEDLPA